MVYSDLCFSVSALWGHFSAAELMWLLPLLWERTSVVLHALGSK